MSDIQFQCPYCGSNLEVSYEGAGMEVPCPVCSKQVTIPSGGSKIKLRVAAQLGPDFAEPGSAEFLAQLADKIAQEDALVALMPDVMQEIKRGNESQYMDPAWREQTAFRKYLAFGFEAGHAAAAAKWFGHVCTRQLAKVQMEMAAMMAYKSPDWQLLASSNEPAHNQAAEEALARIRGFARAQVFKKDLDYAAEFAATEFGPSEEILDSIQKKLRENADRYRGRNVAECRAYHETEGRRLGLEWRAAEFKPRKGPEEGTYRSSKDVADSNPSASGTGFFVTEDGFLISNAHVVEGAAQVRLVTSAGLISARVVKVDAANDMALLKAEGRFAALPVAASRAVKLGGTVATVGFPNIGLQGFAPKLARGEIASLSGARDDPRYVQISVPVQPGNSGGALVDERGNVVGVVSAKLSARVAFLASGALPENVNYAVKSSYLLSFLESVPEVSARLKEPNTKDRKFEDVVRAAEQAAVLVLVY